MNIQGIRIDQIDATNRLRRVDPNWVTALVEQHSQGNRWPAIRVVERDGGYRLISGGHRLSAGKALDWETIEADVRPASEFPDEASVRLDEIRENLLDRQLSALDRAVALSAWKDIYDAKATPAPRGRKKKAENREKELRQDPATNFSARFSAAAGEALKISERSIRVAVQIATSIDAAVRDRIAFHAIADVTNELLTLAKEPAERQSLVADLLLEVPATVATVAEAIAVLDRAPPPAKVAGWEKISDRFSKLKEEQQRAFFMAHRGTFIRFMTEGA